MLMRIPTYQVLLSPDKQAQTFRVPETEIKAFLDVLIFNGVKDFRVTLEDTP